MRTAACKIALCAALSTGLAAVQAAPETAAGPSATASITPIVAPKDRAYTGEIHLKVDASDTSHRVMHVHETLSGVGPDTVLLYPKWLPGTHAPEGTIDPARRYPNHRQRCAGCLEARSGRCLRVPLEFEARHARDRHRLRLSLAHQRQSRRAGNEP